jgi:hypothetical protein
LLPLPLPHLRLPLPLQVLTRLTRLNLYGCRRLSDAGMAALERLPLVALSMGHTRVRDDGMKSLAKLTSLTELHFVREDIRIEGLKHLSTLKQLHVLAMRDLRVTNQHLQVRRGLLRQHQRCRSSGLFAAVTVHACLHPLPLFARRLQVPVGISSTLAWPCLPSVLAYTAPSCADHADAPCCRMHAGPAVPPTQRAGPERLPQH